ncbi:MAG: hypothetical protein NT167_30100 [Verrucomicrobia bacterium]|nr:hypothetical protein [Verrucomicrobiota bacterium]
MIQRARVGETVFNGFIFLMPLEPVSLHEHPQFFRKAAFAVMLLLLGKCERHGRKGNGWWPRAQAEKPLETVSVRIAEFSVAVTVVDHVGVRFPQSWGLMEAISEACGLSV